MGANKMSNTYRVVRLMKNQLYPTYQLHAYMANKKTAPRDGLRLAGLITMEWLRQRLGDHAPEEFLRLPEPSAYLSGAGPWIRSRKSTASAPGSTRASH